LVEPAAICEKRGTLNEARVVGRKKKNRIGNVLRLTNFGFIDPEGTAAMQLVRTCFSECQSIFYRFT